MCNLVVLLVSMFLLLCDFRQLSLFFFSSRQLLGLCQPNLTSPVPLVARDLDSSGCYARRKAAVAEAGGESLAAKQPGDPPVNRSIQKHIYHP